MSSSKPSAGSNAAAVIPIEAIIAIVATSTVPAARSRSLVSAKAAKTARIGATGIRCSYLRGSPRQAPLEVVVVHLTDREWWTLIHGMILGSLFLLAFSGGLAGLYSLRADYLTPEGLRERVR